jgi:hypothetical protein
MTYWCFFALVRKFVISERSSKANTGSTEMRESGGGGEGGWRERERERERERAVGVLHLM